MFTFLEKLHYIVMLLKLAGRVTLVLHVSVGVCVPLQQAHFLDRKGHAVTHALYFVNVCIAALINLLDHLVSDAL